MKTLLKRLLIGLIGLYQSALSPYLGGHCRFQPSCSEYTRTAIRTHGPFRGTWLGLKRLLKCHPFSSEGGWDPVPSPPESSKKSSGKQP